MFQRLRDLDQSATDRGVAILTALQEHTSLQEQWTRFAKELVNRCEDLGLEMAQFHRKLTKRGTPQQEHENVLETTDWFELCFFLSYQLLVRTEDKTSAANNFPTRLPRKVQDLWPRKKMRIIGEQFEKIASGCEYEGLEPMRKADVRWCFTADTFATELQRHRLFEWRRFSQPSRLENASENNEHHKENDMVDGVHNSKTSEQEPVRSSLGAINFSVAGREEVQNINALLRGDYRIRRELMLERLNVTLESFMWSKRGQEVEQEVVEEFKQLLSGLSKEPCTVNIDDILRADPMALVPSDSGDEVMKSSHLRSLVIGQVPDRGGRIDDLNEKDMKRAARGAWDLQRSNRKSQSIKAATEKLPTLEIRLQLSQDTNGVDMKNIERHKKKKKTKSVPKQDAPDSPSPTKVYP